MFWKHLPRTSLEAIIEASLNATREEPAPHRAVSSSKGYFAPSVREYGRPGARQRRRRRERESLLCTRHVAIASEKETKSISTTFIIDTEVGDALESATAS